MTPSDALKACIAGCEDGYRYDTQQAWNIKQRENTQCIQKFSDPWNEQKKVDCLNAANSNYQSAMTAAASLRASKIAGCKEKYNRDN